jgi:hypothetical protein
MKSLPGIAVCFLALSGLASAQAAVEGALTHGLSGAASASAGKELGQVGNQLAGRLGQQTSNAVRPAVTTVRPGAQKIVRVPRMMPASARATNSGSLIASIQGGEPQQAKACTTSDQKQTQCVGTNPADKDSHPAEITLPAPK